ncbi:hypothetical protein B0T14DRAFT_266030 [Immersiella caudata]|uniref:Uncharacterized protein n=1 Tax=Immersiella caudata TaxID=314043 RepID=A0AA39WL38_9PEZI|nr:hypothetical protein B0T14DRAFT_266030 [Immersiella caudata]
MAVPNPYWPVSPRADRPPKGECIPHVLGWSWPGLSGIINWRRRTPTHQDGSHFEPHFDSRHMHLTNPFSSCPSSFSVISHSCVCIRTFAIPCPALPLPSP